MQAFTVGSPVFGKAFHDRVKEIKTLLKDKQNNYVISGPRRIGKTSLMEELALRLDKKTIPIFVDVSGICPLSEENFLSKYLIEVTKAFDKKFDKGVSKKVVGFLSGSWTGFLDFLKTVHISYKGVLEAWFDYKQGKGEVTNIIEETLQYPDKLAEKHNVRCVVFLDEFPLIKTLKNTQFEWALRSNMQKTKNVRYIISCSAQSLTRQMTLRKAPFYGFFLSISLFGIDAAEGEKIIKNLSKFGVNVGEDVVKEVLKRTKCHPLYLQAFALASFTYAKTNNIYNITIKEQEECWKTMYDLLTFHFMETESKLQGKSKAIAISIAKGDERLSEISRSLNYKMDALSTYLRRMMDIGIIEKVGEGRYIHQDPLFAEWLRLKE